MSEEKRGEGSTKTKWVEEDAANAVRLAGRQGFKRHTHDALYRWDRIDEDVFVIVSPCLKV